MQTRTRAPTGAACLCPLLSTSDAAIASGTSITFSVWLERRSQTPLRDRIIGVGNWFALFVEDADATAVRFGRTDGIGAAAEGFVRDAFIPTDVDGWHHYVGIVDRLSASQFALRLFRNGVLRGEQVINVGLPARPNCRFYVGPSGNLCTSTTVDDTSNNLPANLDDVRVYNRALRPVEVQALFREGGFSR